MAGSIGSLIGQTLPLSIVMAIVAVSIYKKPEDAKTAIIVTIVLTVLSLFVFAPLPSILSGVLVLLTYKVLGKSLTKKKDKRVVSEEKKEI